MKKDLFTENLSEVTKQLEVKGSTLKELDLPKLPYDINLDKLILENFHHEELLWEFIGDDVSLTSKELNEIIAYFNQRLQATSLSNAQYSQIHALLGCFKLFFVLHPNSVEALAHFQIAINKENPLAYNLLGYCHAEGVGVSLDPKNAVAFFTMARNKGSLIAINNLGHCYQHGIGVSQDAQKALELFTDAHDRGCLAATINLGHCYGGIGSQQDPQKVGEFYGLAYDRGSLNAAGYLGSLYERDRCYEEAAVIYRSAHEKGDINATRNLAKCYLRIGITQNALGAIRLFLQFLSRSKNKKSLEEALILLQSTSLLEKIGKDSPENLKSLVILTTKTCLILYRNYPDLFNNIKPTLDWLCSNSNNFEMHYWAKSTGSDKKDLFELLGKQPNSFLMCLLKDDIHSREEKLELYRRVYQFYDFLLSAENLFLLRHRLGFLLSDLNEIRTPNHYSYWSLLPPEIIQLVDNYVDYLLPTEAAVPLQDYANKSCPRTPGVLISHYEVLGVINTASLEEIKQACRDLAKKFHLDNKLSGDAEKFIEIQASYAVLIDPIQKRGYDLVYFCIEPFKNIPIHDFSSCRFYLADRQIGGWKNAFDIVFSTNSQVPELAIKCESFKDFFHNCQDDLTREIDKHRKDLIRKIDIFLVWIAMKDDPEMLSNKNFIYIFDKQHPFNKTYDSSFSITVATAFRSKKFILKGFELGLFQLSDVREALSVAVAMRDEEMMRYIIQVAEQFNLNVSLLNDDAYYDNYDYDPLFWALRNNFSAGAILLLNKKINLENYTKCNGDDDTYLHLAIRSDNDISVIQILLAKTKNVLQTDRSGATPLYYARQSGNPVIIALLENARNEESSAQSSPYNLRAPKFGSPFIASAADVFPESLLSTPKDSNPNNDSTSRPFNYSSLSETSTSVKKTDSLQESVQKAIRALFNSACVFSNSTLGISIDMPRGISDSGLTKFASMLKSVGVNVKIQPERIITAELQINNETLESLAAKLSKLSPQLFDFLAKNKFSNNPNTEITPKFT